jgi:lysophospholipase L1-like esterase
MKTKIIIATLFSIALHLSAIANPLVLKAPKGTNHQWHYNGKVLEGCTGPKILNIGNGTFEVSFIDTHALATKKVITPNKTKVCQLFLVGDSTMADYSLEDNYMEKRHPLYGWGQVFQSFMVKDSLSLVRNIVQTDSVVVYDKAMGGRSTRTFFQEGRWREVYDQIKPGDVVVIQFGHNDASEQKPERYVPIEGYQEFLRLFVSQTREKGARPILVTPVARNYPWNNGKLENVHGQYPDAMKAVSAEMNVPLIDLNALSMAHFTAKGQEFVTNNYFMNFGAGIYKAYPNGQKDNTHFQQQGALAVAQLVFDALKNIELQQQPAPTKGKGKKTK